MYDGNLQTAPAYLAAHPNIPKRRTFARRVEAYCIALDFPIGYTGAKKPFVFPVVAMDCVAAMMLTEDR